RAGSRAYVQTPLQWVTASRLRLHGYIYVPRVLGLRRCPRSPLFPAEVKFLRGTVVIELFREAAFDSERVEALCGAFDLASKALHDTARPDIVNEVIAKRIIA